MEPNKVEVLNSVNCGNNPYQHIEYVNSHIEKLDEAIKNIKNK